ncbi:MAG: hypothetical protein ACK5H1_04405 [Tenacibaculum sp.]
MNSIASNIVPIGIINTEFHQCNFGTTLKNLSVSFDSTTGLFYNLADKNPFIKKQSTVISPLVSKAVGNTLQFVINTNYILHKKGKPKIIFQ